jgi:VWFA-related protein
VEPRQWHAPSCALPIALLALVASPVRPQAPPSPATPAFPAKVEVVTVDVVVVDARGRAVPGFTASDFTVLEDGQPQTVTSFQAVDLPPLPPPADKKVERPRVSSNVARELRQGRTFTVVFDDIHLSPEQAFRAKAALGEFLRTGVREADRVMLVATGGAAWWSARMPEGREELVAILKRLDGRYIPDSSPDRITDYEAMRVMVYDDPDVGYQVQRRFDAYGSMGRDRQGSREYADTLRPRSDVGIIDPYVRTRANEIYRQAVARRKITLGVMTRAIQSLADVRGRKAMILVSQGFIFEQDFKEMRQLVEASLRVNVPVYFIDTRGLKALPDFMTATFGSPFDVQDTVAVLADISREAEGSENLALDTGGFVVKNTNDLQGGILRVSAESQAYYLLGYSPRNAARDGKFRRIEVRLPTARAKGLRVRARRGYYAPLDTGEPAQQTKHDPEIVRALDSPFERKEVPLRVSAFTFEETMANRLNTLIAADVDIHDVELKEEEGRFKGALAFLIEAQHRETGEYYRTDEKIEMALLKETRESLLRTGYPVSREFALSPGLYQVKVVVRDLGSGRLGSVLHDFEVPEPGSFRVSSPILSDALEPQPAGANGPPRPVLRVRRQVTSGGTLWVQYSVFGAAKEERTQLPRVSSGYEIRRSGGAVFKSAPTTRINPTSIGSLLRLNGINLQGAVPGSYELVIRLRDEIAGRDLEVREPFEVTAG